MADGTELANALLEVLQRQRNDALNRLAQAEANNAMLTVEIGKLREEAKPKENDGPLP